MQLRSQVTFSPVYLSIGDSLKMDYKEDHDLMSIQEAHATFPIAVDIVRAYNDHYGGIHLELGNQANPSIVIPMQCIDTMVFTDFVQFFADAA